MLMLSSLTAVAADAVKFTWDGGKGHLVDGENITLAAGKGAAKLVGIPVKPGKSYRLHYTAEGIDESGSTALFHNLQISSAPRVEGEFLIQDVRNKPQDAFQNFSISPKVRYRKIDLLFELKTRKGSVKISNLRLEEIVKDERDSWNTRVIHPAYRQTFFAGETDRTLRVEVSGGATWHDSELINDQKVCIAAEKGRISAEKGGVFTMDFSKVPEGEYELISLLTGKNGIQKIVKKQITIAPKAEMEIIAGKNHYFYINGQPFFPVFYFFEMVEDGLLYEASRNGVNMCIMGFNNEAHMLRELDRFHKYGIKGIIYLEQYGHINSPLRFEEFKKDFAARVTEKVRKHPAFFGYMPSDEPLWKGIPVQRMRDYYNFVRKADPYHPIWINEAPRNEIPDLRLYAECADIFGVDIYPVPYPNGHSNLPNKLPSVVGDYTRRFTEVVRGRKPIWMCLQGNSWSDYGFPKTLQRYPTYEESRFMAFDAMTSGSHGYILYSPEHIKNWQFQQELFKVSRELQELSGLFINARRLADAPVSDNDIRCALYEYNGNIYGILLNTSIEKRSGKVKLPAGAVMKVAGKEEILDPENITLEPLQVIVWGKAPMPEACWKQIPVNAEFEGKSAFKEKIDRRRQRRFEFWKKNGITPPQEP